MTDEERIQELKNSLLDDTLTSEDVALIEQKIRLLQDL